MITIPLVKGSPCLRFISNRTNQIKRNNYLEAKIDTGAQYLMIPEKHFDFFKPVMTGDVNYFCSASGHEIIGKRGRFYAKIEHLGGFILNAYFYKGEMILFGIRDFTEFFTLCIDKSNLYVNEGRDIPNHN